MSVTVNFQKIKSDKIINNDFKMKTKRNFLALLMLPLVSCTVYNIPVNEFAQQIENSHIEKRNVEVGSGGITTWWAADSLYTNGIHTLKCYDKKNNPSIFSIP